MMFGKYILLISQWFFVQSLADHYWRDYNGTIPSDAIPVVDTDDSVSYIGQLYVNRKGLWAGTIIPRSQDLEEVSETAYKGDFNMWKLNVIDVMTKILCSKDHSKFIWLKTTAATLKKDLEGQSPIVGGYVHLDNVPDTGVLSIGRTRYNNRGIIVNVFKGENKTLFFNAGGNAAWKYHAYECEVLVYRDTT